MGAGAFFIMAEITGIPYTDIVIAAIIPAILYFLSVYFMVDTRALKNGMKGLPRSELPQFRKLAKQAFLFIPIVILIGALFRGVFRDPRRHTRDGARPAVVSWLDALSHGAPGDPLRARDRGEDVAATFVAVLCRCRRYRPA